MRRHTISHSFGNALGLLAAMGLSACVEQSPDVPSQDDIRVAKENLLAAPPARITYAANASLEGKLTYLGADVDTQKVTPGKPFTITHYWKVEEAPGPGWKLFVHLEAPGTKSHHLNADHVPVGGNYPVSVWKKGDIIRDVHKVSVPANWPSPSVEIYTGLWKGPLRMKVTSGPRDAENRIFVARLATTVAAPPPAKRIVATRVPNGSVKVDGKLDDAVWAKAASTGPFVKSMDGTAADLATEAKLVWDDENLYVAFQMEDHDIWTTLDKHDDKLWTQEAVEMFIDADRDGKTYVELQTNPRGAVFDSYLPRYRQNENDWSANVKVGVQVDGTLDKRDDTDKGWTVEMQVPLASAKGKEAAMANVPPTVGTVWRINFFRMDQPSGKPQQGYAWSPPMRGDFHALDRFGELVFGDAEGKVPVAEKAPPVAEKAADKAEAPAQLKVRPLMLRKADVIPAPAN